MSRDAQRYRKTYSYYRVQPRTELLEVIVDEALDWKNSVRTASTTSHALTGAGTTLSIGGVTVVDEDRVLLKNQATASQNGIYYFEVTGGNYALTRASDARTGTLSCGAATYVEEGTNAGKVYILSTTNPITIDSTFLTWSEFSGGGGGSTPQYWEEWFLDAIITTGSIVGIGDTDTVIERDGSDMKFYDGNNTGGYTLTQLAAGGGGSSPEYWFSTTSGVAYTTGSAGIGTTSPDPTSTLDLSAYSQPKLTLSSGGTMYLSCSANVNESEMSSLGKMKIGTFGNDMVTINQYNVGIGTSGYGGGTLTISSDFAGYVNPTVTLLTEDSSGMSVFEMKTGWNPTGASYSNYWAVRGDQYALDIFGGASGSEASAFRIATGTSNFTLNLNSDGVGIGTNFTYGHKLKVDGSTSITGSVLPGDNGASYDLGASSQRWRTVYANRLTGSLTTLGDGSPYLIAGNNVTLSTGSNGAVTIDSSGGSSSPAYWFSTTNQSVYTTGSVVIRGASTSIDSPADIGSNVFFHVSGTFSSSIAASRVSSFGGDVHVSGNLKLEASNQNKEVELFLKNSASTSFPNVNGSSIVFGIYNNSTQNDYDAKIKAEITSMSGTPRTKLVFNTNDADGRVERMRIKGDSSDGTLISVGPDDTGTSTVTFLSRKDKTSNTQNFWAFGGSNLGEVGGTRYPTGIVFRHYNDNPFGAGVSSNPRSTSTYGSGLRFWTSTNQSDIRGVIDIGTNGDLIMGSNDGSSPTHPGVIRPAEQQSSLSQSSVLLRIRGANATGGSNLAGGSLILSGGLSTGNASGGSIILGVSSPGSAGSTSNNTIEVMRVAAGTAAAGPAVGIGTTSPLSRLHTRSSETNGSSIGVFYATDSSNNSLLWVSGSGYVGIGTSGASVITDALKSLGSNVVSIHGPSASALLFEVNGNLSGSIIASDSGMTIVPGVNRVLSLGSDNSVKMVVENDGDVNIQTADRYFDASIASGQGIRLRSSPGNSDAQVLDCYNESTVQVNLENEDDPGSIILNNAKDDLLVTRVGRLVTICGTIQIADTSGVTGNEGGLLWIQPSSGNFPTPLQDTAVALRTNLYGVDGEVFQSYIKASDAYIYIEYKLGSTVGGAGSYTANGSYLTLMVTYATASS